MTIHQSRLRAFLSRAALSPLLVLVLVIAPSAQAQTILLKTGQTIETKGVRRSGDMVMIKVQVGASSGEVGYRASTIAKIAFPEPLQLKTTAAFLSEGQPEKPSRTSSRSQNTTSPFVTSRATGGLPPRCSRFPLSAGCSSTKRPRGWATKSERP